MTHRTNARIAGFTFLFYIAVGISDIVLFSRATGSEGITAKLAGITQHAFQVRLSIVLGLVQAFCAIVLAVTLYRITCDQDSDLAMLGLTFRLGEGFIGAISTRAAHELLWLGTASGQRHRTLRQYTPLALTFSVRRTGIWARSSSLWAAPCSRISSYGAEQSPLHWPGSVLLPRSFS